MLKLKVEKTEAENSISSQVRRGKELIHFAEVYVSDSDYYTKKNELTNSFKIKYDLWFDITKDILYKTFEDTKYAYNFTESIVVQDKLVSSSWKPDVEYYLHKNLKPKVEYLDYILQLFKEYEFQKKNDDTKSIFREIQESQEKHDTKKDADEHKLSKLQQKFLNIPIIAWLVLLLLTLLFVINFSNSLIDLCQKVL